MEIDVDETPKLTETVDLPSKGLFYPGTSPLSSGTIELHYMTTYHEDILTSTNLIKKGVVLDRLMDSLIATKGVKTSDLLVGDLNAIMVAARILGYGKDYNVSLTCPRCGNVIEQTVDLSQLETKNEPTDDSLDNLTVTLPLSKAVVQLKLLTRGDEISIEKEVKALKKVNGDIESDSTSRLRAMIVSVNSDTSKEKIWSFVNTMLVRDARFLRDAYKHMIPDIDFDITVECDCGDPSDDNKVRLPIGVSFFWPDARV